jgi:hypothetical protein
MPKPLVPIILSHQGSIDVWDGVVWISNLHVGAETNWSHLKGYGRYPST